MKNKINWLKVYNNSVVIIALSIVHVCLSASEALAVDDGGARLVVLLLVDPHRLEGRERGQDGAAQPDGVLALGRSQDLDFVGGGRQLVDLLPHPFAHALEQRGAATEDDVLEQV